MIKNKKRFIEFSKGNFGTICVKFLSFRRITLSSIFKRCRMCHCFLFGRGIADRYYRFGDNVGSIQFTCFRCDEGYND